MTGRLLFAAALLFAIGAYSAGAHEAMSGWRYPASCCSDKDCREADPGEVIEKDGGWFVVPSAEYLPAGDLRVHPSPDGRFHICNQIANDRASKPWCVFTPAFGS